MSYLAGLGALAGLYLNGVGIHRTAIGTIPIAVPWWGAVGSVMLSLAGIFDHCDDWDTCFKYWHWARPFVGGAMASFGVLVFQGGVLAAGNDLTAPTGVADTRSLFYYVVAFVLGYREETTRALIKRVADVIIAPGDTGGPGDKQKPEGTEPSPTPAGTRPGPAGDAGQEAPVEQTNPADTHSSLTEEELEQRMNQPDHLPADLEIDVSPEEDERGLANA